MLIGLLLVELAAVLPVLCCSARGIRAALVAPVRHCWKTEAADIGRRRADAAPREPAAASKHEQLAEATCMALEIDDLDAARWEARCLQLSSTYKRMIEKLWTSWLYGR